MLLPQENESSCQSQLNKFPLVVQTPLLQRRVDDLNKKLKDIDAAKAIFSRSRVRELRETYIGRECVRSIRRICMYVPHCFSLGPLTTDLVR